jgi:hypothetical protein
MKGRHPVLAVFMVAAALLGGCRHEDAEAPAPVPQVVVVMPQRGAAVRSITLPGDVVGYYQSALYAKVTGTDANYLNESVQIVQASFKSGVHGSSPVALVDMTSATVASPFNVGTGQQTGSQAADGVLDSDGDLDWGSNNNSNATGWFVGRAGSMTAWTDAGTPAKFLIGTLDFKVEDGATAGQFTDIQAILRAASAAYTWKEDGTVKSYTGTGTAGLDRIASPPTLTEGRSLGPLWGSQWGWDRISFWQPAGSSPIGPAIGSSTRL